MPYDSPQYVTRSMFGPIKGSFAAVLITAANKTATSVNTNDRIEFFRKVKITGFKTIIVTAPDATAHATPAFLPHAVLSDGTNMLATCPLGTVAGLGTIGGMAASPNVDALENLQLQMKYTADGTLQTMGACSYEAYIEYQERMG